MKVIGQSSNGTVKASKVLAMKAKVQSSKDAVKSAKATVQSWKAMDEKKKKAWSNAGKVTDALRAGLSAMKAKVQSLGSEDWSYYDVRDVNMIWVVATTTSRGKLIVKAFGRLGM